MLFDLVAGATAVPTLSIGTGSLEFDGDKNAINGNAISITASGEWVILCPDWITLNKYWGSGNDTIYITIDVADKEGTILFLKMTNEASQCSILCYAAGYSAQWLGYVSWGYDSNSGGTIYFYAYNGSSKDFQYSQMFWEARDIDSNVVSSGNVSATLDSATSSYPTDAIYSSFASLWGMVSGGAWVQLW
jgi:hypothetical protein